MVMNKLKPVTLHVDATGTVVRPTTLKKNKKNVYCTMQQ